MLPEIVVLVNSSNTAPIPELFLYSFLFQSVAIVILMITSYTIFSCLLTLCLAVFLSAPSQAPPEKPPRVSAQVIVVLMRLGMGWRLLISFWSCSVKVSAVLWKFPDELMAAIQAAVLLGALWLKPDELWALWAHLDNGSVEHGWRRFFLRFSNASVKLKWNWPPVSELLYAVLIVALVSSTKWE